MIDVNSENVCISDWRGKDKCLENIDGIFCFVLE